MILSKIFADTKQKYQKFQQKINYFHQRIKKEPRYILVFLLARFQIVRCAYTCLLDLSKPQSNSEARFNPSSDTLFPNLDTTKILNKLKKDGLFEGLSLPQDILRDILHYAKSQYCFADGKTNFRFKISEIKKLEQIYGRSFYVARYFNISTSCPAILRLAQSPNLQEIARKYVGQPVKYTGASLYWTFPLKGNLQPYEFSKFHYDLEDYKSLRFCFYLSDVNAESGSHICIRGSHKRKPLLSIVNLFSRIYPQNKLIKFYGSKQFVDLTGKAGFGFIEDVFCFHRGSIPQSQPRLFLQLHFAVNNYVDRQYIDDRASNITKSFMN